MKIVPYVKVMAMPVHAAFPYPINPEFQFTQFLYEYGPVNATDASNVETNEAASCCLARPVFVPHNNFVPAEAADVTSDWYNTALPTQNWTKISAGTRMLYMNGIWLTPWIKSTWTDEPARAIYYGHASVDVGSSSTRYNYVPASATIDLHATLPNYCQGFTLELGAELDARTETWTSAGGLWTLARTHPAPSDEKPYVRLRVRIDTKDGVAGAWYTFERSISGQIVVYVSDSVSTLGTKLREILPDADISTVSGNRGYGYHGFYGWYGYGDGLGKAVQVKLVAGTLQVAGFGSVDPIFIPHLEYDDDQHPKCFVRQIAVDGMGIKGLKLGLAPMKFRATGAITVSEENVGFPCEGLSIATWVHYAFSQTIDRLNEVPNTDVTIDLDVSGTIITPTATFTADVEGTYNTIDYAASTAVARAITIRLPETVFEPFGNIVELHCEDVTVDQALNFDNLTINAGATLVFNNFSEISKLHPGAPNIFWGELQNYTGAFAVQISMMKEYYTPDDVFVDSTGWFVVFTGYANLESVVTMNAGGVTKYVCHCHDRSVALQNVIFGWPWMDGWNLYYAAAYVANRNGTKRGSSSADSDLAFRDFVPEEPYDDSTGTASYFLPQGTGGTPLIRFQGGSNGHDVLVRILKPPGFMHYYDVQGKFQVQKFELHSTAEPYRVFHMGDGLQEGTVGDQASAVMEGEVHRSLMEVRNQVTIIGIDAFGPLWDPIVSHRSDDASIIAPGVSSIFDPTQPNFLGRPMSFVWSDSQFATEQYASDAADGIFNVLKNPSIAVQLRTWLQADLYPGYRIGVASVKAGLYDRGAGAYLELMVVGVQHRVNRNTGQTTLRTRFVPPGT